MNNIVLALFTGITTGGISCFSVQSGLLASSIPQNETKNKYDNALRVLIFIFGKLLVYTILGFILGFVGSTLKISFNLLSIFQILAGVFMIATAARLLEIHPIFNKLVISPPKSFFRILRIQSKNQSFISPFIMGVLTILIPCGVTQAMILLAISTGNPAQSTLIMFFFILGTSPIFFLLGLAISEIFKRKAFVYISAVVITALGIMSINSGQIIRGSAHNIQNYWKVLTTTPGTSKSTATLNNQGIQEVTINISSTKYTTSTNTLKINVPVRLTLISNNAQGCIRSFTIPSYNISKILPVSGTEVVEFTPTKLGVLTFTCSMGMYSGSFNVVN